MTVFDLGPSYVKIDYHSPYGMHSHTLPTLQWSSTGLGNPGSFATHDTVGMAGDIMVTVLVDLLAENVPDTIQYDAFTIFNFDADQDRFLPVYGLSYVAVGSLVVVGQQKAVQVTYSLFTELFHQFKLVLLDRPCANVWGNTTVLAATESPIITQLTDSGNGWAGRDGARPFLYRGTSISLNKRLRRKYGMI